MRTLFLSLLFVAFAPQVFAADELVAVRTSDDVQFNYVLTTNGPQKIGYAVILMPGGNGRLNPRLENGKIVMAAAGNFLIRSRSLFADARFVAASTDSTSTPSRINAIVQDLEKRYGKLQVYVVGTSASTNATLTLAETMDGHVAGFIHSSSFNRISSFDPRKLKSRSLIVIHDQDVCRYTLPNNGQASHNKYGTDLIVMTGGKTTGDDCEAYAHHGYNGIERETVDKMKAWILQAR
jgi:hypothetical protein